MVTRCWRTKVAGGWLVTSDASPRRCCGFVTVTLFGVRGLWEPLAGTSWWRVKRPRLWGRLAGWAGHRRCGGRGTRMSLWPGAEGTWLTQGALGSSLWKPSASLFLHPDLPVCIYSKLLAQLHSDSQRHRNLMKFIVITTIFQYDIMA